MEIWTRVLYAVFYTVLALATGAFGFVLGGKLHPVAAVLLAVFAFLWVLFLGGAFADQRR
jgi:hypothetical protein